MERAITHQLKQNPDGDRESRKPTLQNFVQQLDRDAIDQFLGCLSELQDGQASGQHPISWYEVMAREHGKLIIPYISEMMRNVLKVLSSDAPSLALQQACAKVVSALARYTMEPSSFERQSEGVIRDLAIPLLEVLFGNVQSLAEGAAMCLHALMNTEVWKFIPDDIVTGVCLGVAGALEEKGTRTSLAKHNSLIPEASGRSLLKAADDILDTEDWQLRLHAVQIMNALLKSEESDILASEIPTTITNMDRCRSDRIPSIRHAASETLQIAKAIASERGMDVSYESFSSEVEISIEDVSYESFSSEVEFTDFTDGNYDKYDSLRGENTRQTPAALKGRTLLDKLESVADEFSDRSNSQEGSMQNSSVWSESVQISDSLSPTSSDNLFQDVSDNEEDYLTTIPTEPDKRSPRVDDMKENCESAEVDSSEGSVDFPMFEEMSAFLRGWTKVIYLMESMLRGSLCSVLAVPVAMLAVKLFSMKEEYHVMVPT